MALPKDILLDVNGDLAVQNGDLVIVTEADQVRQSWLIHIRTFLGELLLDTSKGVPYIQELFTKRITRASIKSIFTAQSLLVEGVVRVNGVKVNDMNPVTRFLDITVDVQITGGETATFRFNEVVAPEPEGTADPDFPLSVDGLRIWFDPSDLSNLAYNPGSTLILQNKAGTGIATAFGFLGVTPLLVGVSPLNNKRAIFLNNDGFAIKNQYLHITDTPAIRVGAPPEITVFTTVQLKNRLAGGTLQSICDLFGYNTSSMLAEWQGFRADSNHLGSASMLLESGDTGAQSTYAAIIAGGTYNNPHVYAWRNYVTPGFSIDARFWQDSVELTPVSSTIPRFLTGEGYWGVQVDPAAFPAILAASYSYGYFGDLLVYEGVLTDAEIDDVNEYLTNKWGF